MAMGASNSLSEKAAAGFSASRRVAGNGRAELARHESANQNSRASSLPVMGNSFVSHPSNNDIEEARNKYLASTGKVLAFNINTEERTARIQKVMQEFGGYEGDAVKRIQCALECSSGTAKNYLNGDSTPSGVYDERAMAVIPGYFEVKAELAGLRMELDPRHQRKLAEFMRYCSIQAESIFGAQGEMNL